MLARQHQLRVLLLLGLGSSTPLIARATSNSPSQPLAVGTLDLPSLDAILAALAWQGLLNRGAPTLYLRSPQFGSIYGPTLDETWLEHLQSRKGYALLSTNLRWTAQYVGSYKDQRDSIFALSDAGREISSWAVHNLTLRHDLTDNMTLTASIDNVMDNDPPFARTEINYDAVTHTPMGRTFKLGAKVNF